MSPERAATLRADLILLGKVMRSFRRRLDSRLAQRNRVGALAAYHAGGNLKPRFRDRKKSLRANALIVARRFNRRPVEKAIRLSALVRAAHQVPKRLYAREHAKLRKSLERRFSNILKNRRIPGVKWVSAETLCGCPLANLRAHLEALFQPGMSWASHGIDGWHIDHKRPLSDFDLTDPEQQKQAFHFTNLQPLWAADNLRKGSNFT